MQYVLTKAEMKENEKVRAENIRLKSQLNLNEDKVKGVDETQQRFEDVLSSKNKEIRQLKDDMNTLRYSMRSKTVNLGTYPIETAQMMARKLRDIRGNKNLRSAKIHRVRLKGRGHRAVQGRPASDFRSDLPLEFAEDAAVYIDL